MNPAAVLEHLNDTFQLGIDSSQFFTCCYGLLDLKTRTLSFSSAGHPSPILVRANRAVEFRLPGFPVGVVSHPQYDLEVINFLENDRFYFYSDGAVEQLDRSGKQFGVSRFKQELVENRHVALQTSIDLCLGAVLNSSADGGTDDDISMLGIEISAK